MDLFFLDVQNLFKNTKLGRDMIYALEKCENEDFFNNPVVQMIIDNQWEYWRIRSFIFFGGPLTI